MKELEEYKDVLVPKDLQKILRVSRSTVYKLLDQGEIKSVKVGCSYRIPKQNVLDFLYPNSTTVTRKETLS